MTSSKPAIDVLIAVLGQESPGAVELARTICLAVRIEPELLRWIRLALLPQIDAGAEADLWFSPLIHSRSSLAITLLPEVAAQFRQELRRDQSQLDQAWRTIEQAHRAAPLALRLEEEITWLALSERPGAIQQLERRLQEALAAMLRGDNLGVARWAVRALPLLPEAARNTEAAWMLALAAGARLGGRRILDGEIPGNAVRIWLPHILPPDLPRVPLSVRLGTDGLEVSTDWLADAHVIEAPRTNPLLLEISWQEDNTAQHTLLSLAPGEHRQIEHAKTEILLQTALGERYRLRVQPAPKAPADTPDQAIIDSGAIPASEQKPAGTVVLPAADSNATRSHYEAEVARLNEEIERQQKIIEQFEQMQVMFGDATPPAVVQGLNEARDARARAEAELAAAEAALAALIDRTAPLNEEIERQQRIIEQFEQMQAMFGDATPPAVVQGLNEARDARDRAKAALAALIDRTAPPQPAAIAVPRLVLDDGRELILPTDKREIIVGREDPIAGIFPEIDLTPYGGESGGVSRQHARLNYANGQWTVTDLNSTNYTRIGGTPITPNTPTPLADGARLRFGRIEFTFRAQAELSGGTAAPQATAPATSRLVFENGNELALPTNKREIIVGREDPISGIFPEIDLTPYGGEIGGVSRQHARLTYDNGQWIVTDLNSTNYTRIDGVPLEPNTPTALADGNRLSFGRLLATFRI